MLLHGSLSFLRAQADHESLAALARASCASSSSRVA